METVQVAQKMKNEALEVAAWKEFKTNVLTRQYKAPLLVKQFYDYTMSLGFRDEPAYDEWIENFNSGDTWRGAPGEIVVHDEGGSKPHSLALSA